MTPVTDLPRVDLDAGGMARVYLVLRPEGASRRVVAVKEMHPHLARDRECQVRFLDEARITSRVHHPNVVRVLDIVQARDGMRIVMEYVHGASLSQVSKRLAARGDRMPKRHAFAVLAGVLTGLHAAHEAKTEEGQPLGVVHRDVTPRNILVGVDGVPRLIDFGIARAALRDAPATRTGIARGTPYYMAPEQLGAGVIARGTDIFLCGLILWELVTGRRLSQTFQNEGQFWLMVAQGRMPRAREYVPALAPAVEELIDRALAVRPEDRFPSAEAMRLALAEVLPPSSAADLGAWIRDITAEDLARRDRLIASLESGAPAEPEPEEPEGPATATSTETSTLTRTAPATAPEAWPDHESSTAEPESATHREYPSPAGPAPRDKTTARIPLAAPAGPPPQVSPEPMPPKASTDPMPPSLATDEKTTTPMVRRPSPAAPARESAVPVAQDDLSTAERRVQRRTLLPVAGALFFLALGALLGVAALSGETAPGAALSPDTSLSPSSVTSIGLSASPPETTMPPAAPPPPASSSGSAPGATSSNAVSSAPIAASPRPAASPPPPKPASNAVCTYQDEKKITRVTSCAHAECLRRGRACKPVGQR